MAYRFAHGLPLWTSLGAGDPFQWLLTFTAWTPTGADVSRADIAAYEPTDGSYAPQPVVDGAESFTVGNTAVEYTAEEPMFPVLAGGGALGWVVLAQDTGSAATDTLLAAYPIIRVVDGTDVRLILDGPLASFPAGASA